MNKINTICLRCGKVQVRTDIMEEINDKYIRLSNPMMCPKCKIKTSQIATKDIKELRKKLEQNPSGSLDSHVIKLIKR